MEQTEALIHTYVSSRLIQNNSLLTGIPKENLNNLQEVENESARLNVDLKKGDHVTPTFFKLYCYTGFQLNILQ